MRKAFLEDPMPKYVFWKGFFAILKLVTFYSISLKKVFVSIKIFRYFEAYFP